MDKDIVIIGGGPGGYAAAIRAAQLDAKVAIVEKDNFGGTCLNRGCIPTKVLLRNAEILNTLKHIDNFGIDVDGYKLNVEVMQNRKNKIIEKLRAGIEQLLKANKIEIINGTGELTSKNSLRIKTRNGDIRNITASNIIIATGSLPSYPHVPGIDLDGVASSDDALEFNDIPKSLAIIGGGVIGMEFASIFNAMGTKVTVIEFLPKILSQVDSDIVKRFMPYLKRKGIEIFTSSKVTKIEKQNENLIVHYENKAEEKLLEAQNVLVATGRKPKTDEIGLDNADIEYDRHGIKVNDSLETNIKGIYAIGDVNGLSMLAHAATHQGIETAERIMGRCPYKSRVIPGCIFTFPEIAFAGITEDEAKQKGIDYKTSRFMFGANGKALAIGEPEGMVKVISSGNKITGVHIMGPHASDLIHEGALAIENNMEISGIKNTIHAHPTLSEAFYEAVMGLDGESINSVPIKRQAANVNEC